MSDSIKALTVRDFIGLYNIDQSLFDFLPEFDFIKPIAVTAKANNCMCGLSDQLNQAILKFNDIVGNFTPDVIDRVKEKFGVRQACFVVQTADSYSVKCY